MNKLKRLSEIQNLLKMTFDFSEVNVNLSNKEDNLCRVEVTFNGSEWKTTEVYLSSPDNEIIYLLKLALFNNMWDEEYAIDPKTKIVNTIIDEFDLGSYGYYMIRNTLYEQVEDCTALDEITGISGLKKLSVTFDGLGNVDTLILTTGEGEFLLTDDGAKYEPERTGCKCNLH